VGRGRDGALLHGLSPSRAAASALPERAVQSNEAIGAGAAEAQEPATPVASLTQSPLVMRMSNDEFRVAFGVEGAGCVDRQ